MDHLRITVEGKAYDVVVEKIGGDENSAAVPAPAAAVAPARATAPPPSPAPAPKTEAAAGDALSPLAGIVQAIEATVGAAINEGDLVITLEAMKMYTPINATASGTIKAIHVKVGEAVEEGQLLYTIG